MNPSEMIKIYSMNLDEFETYALERGYTFKEIKDNEEKVYGHTYIQGRGITTKYLTLYTKYIGGIKMVTYQTSISSEFLNIKNQMKTLGFILHTENDYNGTPHKEYRNNKYEMSVYTGAGEDGTNFFEISLNKF
jgi:hypothetical protein